MVICHLHLLSNTTFDPKAPQSGVFTTRNALIENFVDVVALDRRRTLVDIA